MNYMNNIQNYFSLAFVFNFDNSVCIFKTYQLPHFIKKKVLKYKIKTAQFYAQKNANDIEMQKKNTFHFP